MGEKEPGGSPSKVSHEPAAFDSRRRHQRKREVKMKARSLTATAAALAEDVHEVQRHLVLKAQGLRAMKRRARRAARRASKAEILWPA